MDYLDKHESIEEWNCTFGVEAQMVLCDTDIALGSVSTLSNDECPSLGLFKMCYGKSALDWMVRHIDVLNIVSSVQNKLSDQQIKILAVDIFAQYYYWNLADVCVFFGKIRRGSYGHFYGTIDNIMIMEWAKMFDKVRQEEITRYENAVAKSKAEQQRAAEQTININEYMDTLENKEDSALYAVHTGKKKLFAVNPQTEVYF